VTLQLSVHLRYLKWVYIRALGSGYIYKVSIHPSSVRHQVSKVSINIQLSMHQVPPEYILSEYYIHAPGISKVRTIIRASSISKVCTIIRAPGNISSEYTSVRHQISKVSMHSCGTRYLKWVHPCGTRYLKWVSVYNYPCTKYLKWVYTSACTRHIYV